MRRRATSVAGRVTVAVLLLDVNPLADIRHTTRVRGVVRAGRWLDRAALDRLRQREGETS